jgi:SSS family solute:Na+ symporter
VALLLVRATSALDAWWTLSGVLGGGMLGLFLLGMISRRAGNPAAAAGVCLGILVISWMTLSTYLPDGWSVLRNSLHAFMVPVLGTLTILLTGLVVSRFKAARSIVRSKSDNDEDAVSGGAS